VGCSFGTPPPTAESSFLTVCEYNKEKKNKGFRDMHTFYKSDKRIKGKVPKGLTYKGLVV
jgi:hypothetical protein